MIENWLKSIRPSPNFKKGARGRPSKTLNEEEGTLRKKCPYSELFCQYFPAFRPNTERYGVPLRIQFECGKMRTIITPNTDTFHEVKLTNCDFRSKRHLLHKPGRRDNVYIGKKDGKRCYKHPLICSGIHETCSISLMVQVKMMFLILFIKLLRNY